MKTRVAGLGFGLAFGFWLSWSQFTSFDVINSGLLLHKDGLYLWFMFATGVVAASLGMRALRAAGARTLLGGELITLATGRPTRQHIVGSVLFGLGWAFTGSCPGPIAAAIGHGQLAAVFTATGVFAGVAARGYILRRRVRRGSEPSLAADTGACAQA